MKQCSEGEHVNTSNWPFLPKQKPSRRSQGNLSWKHRVLLLRSHPLFTVCVISLKASPGICLRSVVVLPVLSTGLLLTYSAQFNLWPKCLSLICVIGAEQRRSLCGCFDEALLCLSCLSLLLWEEIWGSSSGWHVVFSSPAVVCWYLVQDDNKPEENKLLSGQ